MAVAGKALAAGLLGLPLAVGLIGLGIFAWPGPLAPHTLPWLLLFFPTWIGTMSAAFFFPTGKQAWLWLGGATLVVFALLVAVKHLGWIRLPP